MKKLLLLSVLACSITTYAQNIEFPDAELKAALLFHNTQDSNDSVIDTNGDGEISQEEALAVTNLTISRSSITDTSGLEFFLNITKFTSTSNPLLNLDLSKNVKLIEINVARNNLETLILPETTTLKEVSCNGNQLESLDLSKVTGLLELRCNDNKLTNLNFGNNPDLELLWCYENELPKINLTEIPALKDLRISNNNLREIVLTENPVLETLICRRNDFEELDISKNLALTTLQCDRNELTSINLEANINLRNVDLSNNLLASIDVSKNINIEQLYTRVNPIKTLDVSNNSKLKGLWSSENELTTLNLDGNPLLELLECQRNQLVSLEITQNTGLIWLMCFENKLQSINAVNNSLLVLDCSANPDLTTLLLTGNPFRTFDDGSGVEIEVFFENAPNVEFICIDEIYLPLIKNRCAQYANKCSITTDCTLSVDSQIAENFKFFPNPSTENFTIGLNETKKEITVTVIDLLGKTVQKNTFRNTNTLNVSHQLSKGLYIVKLETENEAFKFNHKLIVK